MRIDPGRNVFAGPADRAGSPPPAPRERHGYEELCEPRTAGRTAIHASAEPRDRVDPRRLEHSDLHAGQSGMAYLSSGAPPQARANYLRMGAKSSAGSVPPSCAGSCGRSIVLKTCAEKSEPHTIIL